MDVSEAGTMHMPSEFLVAGVEGLPLPLSPRSDVWIFPVHEQLGLPEARRVWVGTEVGTPTTAPVPPRPQLSVGDSAGSEFSR